MKPSPLLILYHNDLIQHLGLSFIFVAQGKTLFGGECSLGMGHLIYFDNIHLK